MAVLGPLQVKIPRPGSYLLTIHLDGQDAGSQTITKPLAIRSPDLDAARDLTDEQVAADAADLDQRLATTTDANERRTLLKGRQELEWLQHEKGTARPFEAPDERYQHLPGDAGGDAAVPGASGRAARDLGGPRSPLHRRHRERHGAVVLAVRNQACGEATR
jgi:hypothetical protein